MNYKENEAIWKYELPVEDEVTIELPISNRILCIQIQNGKPYIWVWVATKAVLRPHKFYVVGTGNPMPEGIDTYIGTFQLNESSEGFVFHVFTGIM